MKWSSEGAGYLLAVTARMLLSLLIIYVVLALLRLKMPWNPAARKTYLAGGFSIYVAMTCVYWASQYIPSGWIAVIFGLSPIITGVLAIVLLNERALRPHKLAGMLLGVCGLLLVCETGLEAGTKSLYGIAVALRGAIAYSFSALWIKRINAQLSGLVTAAGGLTIAVPLYLVTWAVVEGTLPASVSAKAIYAIVYLAIAGSVVGFALYYYVLMRMDVTHVALITLITPVCALLLGKWLDDEPLSKLIAMGAALIILGLIVYQFGDRVIRRW